MTKVYLVGTYPGDPLAKFDSPPVFAMRPGTHLFVSGDSYKVTMVSLSTPSVGILGDIEQIIFVTK